MIFLLKCFQKNANISFSYMIWQNKEQQDQRYSLQYQNLATASVMKGFAKV